MGQGGAAAGLGAPDLENDERLAGGERAARGDQHSVGIGQAFELQAMALQAGSSTR
ncbi:MAG TPA: hypothetical protein VJY34_21820 [Roseiarcus sp.]|nr:hypothetical protein [Roseiarcus sp.]